MTLHRMTVSAIASDLALILSDPKLAMGEPD